MEDLLAVERAAEQNVHYLLNRPDEPIVNLLKAFEGYRAACQATIFADFENGAARKEAVLWQAHTDGKKYFHKALSPLRKQPNEQPVAMRHLIKLYLQFLKESQRFYRQYIQELHTRFGGIPELEAVAHQVKTDASSDSLRVYVSPEMRQMVLTSCHQTLIYLGDLSRYRASEKLDKDPDFGPANGYYSLACTLCPSSGMGHHQQAVIALDQQHHLRAVLHLYRAIVVAEPHPNAAQNLKREFDRTNAAWDRGELIPRGSPNDPDSAKNTLVGWFVRLHSMCFKGEPFRGYEELEREVLGQLAAETKQRPLDATLMRMILINLAAQWNAAEKFQVDPIQQNQNAFLHFFRFNIKTFTTLLRVFHDDLRTVDLNNINEDDDDQNRLAQGLTITARRILPVLRLYSSWLLPMTALLEGLSADDMLSEAIEQFWPIYAKAVDLVAAVFPIWDLEELPEITYLLEEDADTLGFKPLEHEKTSKIWHSKTTGVLKPRFSDSQVQRAQPDQEMLARVKDFLIDGLYLANDDESAPIKLQATRILHRDAQDVEVIMPVFAKKVAAAGPTPNGHAILPPVAAKPLSYAAAAANGYGKGTARNTGTDGVAASSSGSRDAQLSRMVDDLVEEDDEVNNPVTPPQPHATHPAVVTKGDVSYSALPAGAQGFAQVPGYTYPLMQKPIGSGVGTYSTPPNLRTPKEPMNGNAADRLQLVSSLWHDSPGPHSSPFPAGLPTGTLGSPAHFHSRGHSRVNSASSIRSRTSQTLNNGIADSWSSIESAPRSGMASAFAAGFSSATSNVASPLLFGAGDSVWSTNSDPAYRNMSPPNGQGG